MACKRIHHLTWSPEEILKPYYDKRFLLWGKPFSNPSQVAMCTASKAPLVCLKGKGSLWSNRSKSQMGFCILRGAFPQENFECPKMVKGCQWYSEIARLFKQESTLFQMVHNIQDNSCRENEAETVVPWWFEVLENRFQRSLVIPSVLSWSRLVGAGPIRWRSASCELLADLQNTAESNMMSISAPLCLVDDIDRFLLIDRFEFEFIWIESLTWHSQLNIQDINGYDEFIIEVTRWSNPTGQNWKHKGIQSTRNWKHKNLPIIKDHPKWLSFKRKYKLPRKPCCSPSELNHTSPALRFGKPPGATSTKALRYRATSASIVNTSLWEYSSHVSLKTLIGISPTTLLQPDNNRQLEFGINSYFMIKYPDGKEQCIFEDWKTNIH